MSAEVVQTYIRSFYGLVPGPLLVRSRSSAPAPIRPSPLSTAPPKSKPVFGSDAVEALLALPVPDKVVPVAPDEDPVLPDEPLVEVVPVEPELPVLEPVEPEPEPPAPDPEPLDPEPEEDELVDACTTIVPFMNG